MKNIFINDIINDIINPLNQMHQDNDLFDCVYVLMTTSDEPIPKLFYYIDVPEEIFNNVSKHLIIYKVNKKILSMPKHKYNSVIVSKENLLKYNIYNYKLNDNNLVIPILNIKYNHLINYIEQFTDNNNLLQNVYNFVLLNKYFNYDKTEQLLNMINDNSFSDFWSNYNNNNSFISNKKKSLIKDYENNSTVINYEDINNSILCINNNLTINDDNITINDINELFMNLDNKCRFLLFCNLLVSYKYCHLVINNPFVLNIMKSDLNDAKFYRLFKYLLSYTWLKIYSDEMNNNLKYNIFELDTAYLLPRFSYSLSGYRNNPYCCIYNDHNDYISGPNSDFCGGLNNLIGFKKYFNIFCTNNENNNIFENINFSEYNSVICGSSVTACLKKEPVLMELFNQKTINNYFSEYYATSDIDIMFVVSKCQTDNFIIDKSNMEFINKVKMFYNQVNNNICNINKPYSQPSHNKLSFIKQIKLYLNDNIIRKIINTGDINKLNRNELRKVLENNKAIYNKFTEHYNNIFNENIKLIDKNEFIDYPELFDNDNNNIRVILDDNILEDNKYKVEISFKFYINSPYINHKLELFSVKNDNNDNNNNNIFNLMISHFHMPCVRAYYNGNNVYLTPSCISALMTNMNIDYRPTHYDINSIIIKYHIRGFGTFMTTTKKRKLKNWLSNSKYKKLYSSSIDYSNIEDIFNVKFYKPRLYLADLYSNCDYVETDNRYKNNRRLKNIVVNNDSSILGNIIKLVAIEGGSIINFKKWVIDLYYNEFYKYVTQQPRNINLYKSDSDTDDDI